MSNRPENQSELSDGYIGHDIRRDVLQFIGESKKPMSSTDVEKRLNREYNNKKYGDTYRVIYELGALDSQWKIILIQSWNEISYKREQEFFKLEFVKNLLQTLAIFANKSAAELLPLPEISTKRNKKKASSGYQFIVRQSKTGDDKSYHALEIFLDRDIGSNPSFNATPKHLATSKREKKQHDKVIELYYDTSSKAGKLVIYVKPPYKIPLFVKENEEEQDITLFISVRYTKGYLRRNKTPFLKHVLKKSAETRISNLAERKTFYLDRPHQSPSDVGITRDISGEGSHKLERQFQVQDIENNPKNFRYYLNLRGFLMFLFKVQSHPQHKRKIKNVIRGLIENECTRRDHDFDFLRYYGLFETIYGTDFVIDILKQIASGMYSMLKRTDDDFIRYWVTREFHSAMIYSKASRAFPYPIYHPIQVALWKDKISENRNESIDVVTNSLKEYDRTILQYLLRRQQNEIEFTRKLLKDIAA